MTVPGGVPNLPTGALTVDTLGTKLQDMTPTAMKARAGERFPALFNSSSGGNPLSDLTPLGILTWIWANFNSAIANADPADIEGPDDLPELLWEFVENLPVIGELVGLLEAILGTYEGDDEILLTVQEIFAPIRKLVELVSGFNGGGLPTVEDIISGWADILKGDSPLNLANVFGWLQPGHLSLLPAAHVTDAQPNMAPGFAAPFPTVGPWSWDNTVRYEDQPASARTEPDGTAQVMLSDPIPVRNGDKFTLSAPVMWEDLVATGTVVQIGLLPNNTATPTMVAQRNAGTAGLDWTVISGTYTVNSPDISSVQIAYRVNASATDGVVHVGEPTLKKTGLIRTSLIADTDGNGLPDILEGKVGLGAFDALKTVLGGSLSQIGDRLSGFLTSLSPINGSNILSGSIGDGFIPGIGTIINNIAGSILGFVGSWTHNDAKAALEAQAEMSVGNAADIAQLKTAFTSGVSTGDDFERSGSLGSNWSVVYTSGPGSISLDGHYAKWNNSPLSVDERTVKCRWLGTNAESQTDYQRASLVMGSTPENPILPGSSPAENHILLRMDSGGTNYILFRWRGDGTVAIIRVVAGVATTMNSGPCPLPVAGTTLTAEAGKFGTARYFRAITAGQVLEVTEVGSASQVGTSYRGWGFGMKAGSKILSLIPTQSLPGKVNQWTASDQ